MEALAVLTETVSFFNGIEMVEVKEGSQVKVDLSLSAAQAKCGTWFDISTNEYLISN